MQEKFNGVQPELGPEEQRSDKKESGIAVHMTPGTLFSSWCKVLGSLRIH